MLQATSDEYIFHLIIIKIFHSVRSQTAMILVELVKNMIL